MLNLTMGFMFYKKRSNYLKLFVILILGNLFQLLAQNSDNKIEPYIKTLILEGSEPYDFVIKKLDKFPLLIFDDALHPAKEPFDFYINLIKNPSFNRKAKLIFVEVFSISSQPLIDKYLESSVKDSTILFKVFQDDFTGMGLKYKTYFDLLSTVWDINKGFVNDSDKIKIIGVDMPVSWCSINSKSDYELFQKSLGVRDYFLYMNILNSLGKFDNGKRGIFLTNTRHSYKNIKDSTGNLYWNCNTFFNYFYPGKTYSIRFHNVILKIESVKKSPANKTVEGLSEINYSWAKIEGGRWDSAFALYNKPVAIPLEGNIFGMTKYMGNHMLNVLHEQTMYDSYDAIIYLEPLNKLHFSAMVNWIYTDEFKKEMARRIYAVNDGNIDLILDENKCLDINDYINKITAYKDEQLNYFVK